jgi:hypothetical protein
MFGPKTILLRPARVEEVRERAARFQDRLIRAPAVMEGAVGVGVLRHQIAHHRPDDGTVDLRPPRPVEEDDGPTIELPPQRRKLRARRHDRFSVERHRSVLLATRACHATHRHPV